MSKKPLSVTLTRRFDAPVELVYRAWTESEHVKQWMKCDAEATLEVENWIPAVGTAFKTHMFKPGAFEAWGSGQFTEVDPPRLLAYINHADPKLETPEMRVRVELVDRDGKTELTLTHTGIPTDMLRGIIEAGWTTSLGLLRQRVLALQDSDSVTRLGSVPAEGTGRVTATVS